MAQVSQGQRLPHWNLDQYFPGLDSSEFSAALAGMKEDAQSFASLVSETTSKESDDPVQDVDRLLRASIDVLDQVSIIMPYIHGHLAVNSRDELAQRLASEAQIALLPLNQANTRLTAWLGTQDVDALIAGSEIAREHEYMLRQAKTESRHLMDQAEEDLAGEMTLSGGSAFGQLHDDLTSQIMVRFEKRPGEEVELPMSEVRNLAMEPDRDVRHQAFEAEIAAWKQWETPIAAALNGVKGEHVTLAKRRKWESGLEQSLFQNHIDRETLDAMMTAAREAFPDIRRYYDAKAKALGIDKLMWYDITAPVGDNNREWSWTDGMDFIMEQFGEFSPKMRDMVRQALDEEWIDAEPRPGKVGGAFCMGTKDGKSAVLSNFTPSFDGVSTMAHELGHAYHNVCEKDRTVLQRSGTPMTLAETASTFCETILRKAAIEKGTEDEQFAILEGALVDAGQIVVDISSRFLFEQAVFEQRAERRLSADEFSELMLDAQRQTYGDGIAAEGLHPYMWAVKGHYYSPDFAFYNYPYMFGLLFGLGLYAKYQEDPDAFRASYDDLLSSTGIADAAELTARFGFDIRTPDFWRSSLDVIRQDIDQFVALVEKRTGK
ncbi:MAG TPA: M3 family oligoendopeptidase [Thermomicrobiales bacterium]|nr:M3 family oligoendopeptidase [Thermomicrobiales bacterium]